MDPAGMVHALEMIAGLLTVNGILIDIHPTGQAPILEIDGDKRRLLAGYLQESDDFIEYTQADEAIAIAIQRGWYRSEQHKIFIFETIAFSLDQFQEYLDEKYQDAILTEGTKEKIHAALAKYPDYRLVMSENILITRLRRFDQNPIANRYE